MYSQIKDIKVKFRSDKDKMIAMDEGVRAVQPLDSITLSLTITGGNHVNQHTAAAG